VFYLPKNMFELFGAGLSIILLGFMTFKERGCLADDFYYYPLKPPHKLPESFW
jgi:hypothetical protein